VRLFIDRQRLDSYGVPLALVVTEPGLEQPPDRSPVTTWQLDTGFTGDAFAWREHLVTAGLDPDVRRHHTDARISASVVGDWTSLPVRQSDLWLVSNLEELRGEHYPLRLRHGIVFRDSPIIEQNRSAARALIGMRLLFRSKLKVELDLQAGTLSIWIPELPNSR
jgi:hypothetical protein